MAIILEEVAESLRRCTTKLENIFAGRPESPISPEEYIGLYTDIYHYCLYKSAQAGDMYDMYRAMLEEYLSSAVVPSLRERLGEAMLRELEKRWADHTVRVRWLSHFFRYLDRFFVPRKKVPPVLEVGIACFRDLVYVEFCSDVRDAVICLIDEEREGAKVDRALLKSAVGVFVEIGGESNIIDHYENDFEAAMLDDTTAYYSRKASIWVAEDSFPEYMVKSEACLTGEKERAHHYLQPSTEEKLLERARQELLSVHQARLIQNESSGCLALLRGHKADDLSRMYRLFSTVPHGLDPIAQMFGQHVTAEGTALVKQAEADAAAGKTEKKDVAAEDQPGYVGKVIELHDKYLAYANTCFQNHALFHRAFKEALEYFFNKDVAGSSGPDLLATFCDNILKKGSGSDQSAEEALDKAVRLLVYLSDKDLFAEFCRKKLGRRLLFDRGTGDNDLERSFLTKLKQQCGGQFTSKMEGMVTDLTLSKDTNAHFQQFIAGAPAALGTDLSVNVLTTGLWPSYKSFDLSLPEEMVRCVEAFTEFYQTRTRHRRLSWVYSLGSCNIVGRFDAKPVELVVTTHQAAVLLLFNSTSTLSYSEIVQQLALTDHEDAVRVLHSLSCGKYKILNKVPNNRTIGKDDIFEFNSKFTDKMRRIRVPMLPLDEKKKVREDVDKERRYAVDAALVRIMKSRKVLGYQQLVIECVQQLSNRFKPDVKTIKKRVDDLVARDYLERDQDNPNMFKFLP